MLRSLLGAMKGQRDDERRARQQRDLIRREAAIGGQLFGPLAKGARREFFCLNRHTWIWHEEWVDAQGQRHAIMTRYDVRPQGVYKAQDGQPYRPLNRQEARHFYRAVMMYHDAVKREVYGDLTYLNALAAA
jgi:hypothetical protein